MKTDVIFWTGSGNTQVIAEAIYEALEDAGCTASIHSVSEIDVESVADADFFFLGCPSMTGEDIEEYEFRPFFEDLKPYLKDKPVLMFGSYDWGDGEWMDSWVEETKALEADVKTPIIYQWEPSDEQVQETYDLVTALVSE